MQRMKALATFRLSSGVSVHAGDEFTTKNWKHYELNGMALRVTPVPVLEEREHPTLMKGADKHSWWMDLRDQIAVVVVSGPSAAKCDLARYKDRAVFFAANESYRLSPWSRILYGCDRAWWKAKNGVPEFAGTRVTQCGNAASIYKHLYRVRAKSPCNEMLMEEAGFIGSAGNSGFQLFNLVAQMLPRAIVLVGFDMTVKHGTHWHGDHKRGLNNPKESTFLKWRTALDGAAKVLAQHGIDVINASPVSTLMAYRKMSIEEAFNALEADRENRRAAGFTPRAESEQPHSA